MKEKKLEINLSPNVELYIYKCKVIRVVDADTVDAELDLGFGIKMTQRFRINDYDAPETWKPRNEAEKIHGHEATERATELLMGKELYLKSSKVPGIYGRYGGTIWLEDGRDFKEVMISEGYAKKENY
jgi:endonuclease YncB( thermonuclease family)